MQKQSSVSFSFVVVLLLFAAFLQSSQCAIVQVDISSTICRSEVPTDSSIFLLFAHGLKENAEIHIFKIIIPTPYHESESSYETYPSRWTSQPSLLSNHTGNILMISANEIWVTVNGKAKHLSLQISSFVNPPQSTIFNNMTVQYGFKTQDDESVPFIEDIPKKFQFPQRFYVSLQTSSGQIRQPLKQNMYPIKFLDGFCNYEPVQDDKLYSLTAQNVNFGKTAHWLIATVPTSALLRNIGTVTVNFPQWYKVGLTYSSVETLLSSPMSCLSSNQYVIITSCFSSQKTKIIINYSIPAHAPEYGEQITSFNLTVDFLAPVNNIPHYDFLIEINAVALITEDTSFSTIPAILFQVSLSLNPLEVDPNESYQVGHLDSFILDKDMIQFIIQFKIPAEVQCFVEVILPDTVFLYSNLHLTGNGAFKPSPDSDEIDNIGIVSEHKFTFLGCQLEDQLPLNGDAPIGAFSMIGGWSKDDNQFGDVTVNIIDLSGSRISSGTISVSQSAFELQTTNSIKLEPQSVSDQTSGSLDIREYYLKFTPMQPLSFDTVLFVSLPSTLKQNTWLCGVRGQICSITLGQPLSIQGFKPTPANTEFTIQLELHTYPISQVGEAGGLSLDLYSIRNWGEGFSSCFFKNCYKVESGSSLSSFKFISGVEQINAISIQSDSEATDIGALFILQLEFQDFIMPLGGTIEVSPPLEISAKEDLSCYVDNASTSLIQRICDWNSEKTTIIIPNIQKSLTSNIYITISGLRTPRTQLLTGNFFVNVKDNDGNNLHSISGLPFQATTFSEMQALIVPMKLKPPGSNLYKLHFDYSLTLPHYNLGTSELNFLEIGDTFIVYLPDGLSRVSGGKGNLCISQTDDVDFDCEYVDAPIESSYVKVTVTNIDSTFNLDKYTVRIITNSAYPTASEQYIFPSSNVRLSNTDQNAVANIFKSVIFTCGNGAAIPFCPEGQWCFGDSCEPLPCVDINDCPNNLYVCYEDQCINPDTINSLIGKYTLDEYI